jgi:predicted metal-binding membrane protein
VGLDDDRHDDPLRRLLRRPARRTFTTNRVPRLFLFAVGYMAVWALPGLPAFGLALRIDEAVVAALAVGIGAAVLIFAASATAARRSPLAARTRPPLRQLSSPRDVRVGIHHGGYCLACCWSLMTLMAASDS